MGMISRVRRFPNRMIRSAKGVVPSFPSQSELNTASPHGQSLNRGAENSSIGLTNSKWSESQYERWEEYPDESDEWHKGHNRCATNAPRVNYCYECEKHYRPRVDMRKNT